MNSDLKALQNQVAQLQQQLAEKDETIQLNSDLKSLQTQVAQLQQKLAEKDETIQSLNHQLHLFRTARFGRKSEKPVSDKQLSFEVFDEATSEDVASKDKTPTQTLTYTRNKNKTGRKALPKHLPYIEQVHDINEDEKQCGCGSKLSAIGQETSEQLDTLPSVTFRIVHIKKKYACKACEDTVKAAPPPKRPFPKSLASAGLVAAIIDGKFNRHLPLYRQEDIFKSMGTDITRATLGNWVVKAANLLTPLIERMDKCIKGYDIAHCDETGVQVLKEKGRSAIRKSYMWLFSGGPPDKRCFIYQYHPSRAESIARTFFEGFKGYVHADCYRAYVNLDASRISHVACMAHARRYFADIQKANKNKPGIAATAMEYFKKLYAIEKQLKSHQAATETVYQTRQEKARPILDEFHAWLATQQSKVPPKSPIGKALFYSMAHWTRLTKYLGDGRLEIDNNRAERAIKPFVIGRKNWMFYNNPEGAHAGAKLYSLIETCKAHDVNVFAYFKYVLTHIIHCQSEDDLDSLLPFNCATAKLKEMLAIPDLIYPDK